MKNSPLNVVILAAGAGKRMRSELPKVLQPLAGKAMLAHVLDTARSLGAQNICVVVGHGGDAVRVAFPATDIQWANQSPQLGTGHALLQALPHIDPDAPTLVLYGDVPLTRTATLHRLIEAAGQNNLALLTALVPNPHGYGRIVRIDGQVKRIVEEKDADDAERAIGEINTGMLVAPAASLARWLPGLGNQNAQGEYYLTDIVALAVSEGCKVVTAHPGAAWETEGVNNKAQLAQLERVHQRNIAEALMEAGVTLADPARIDVRGELTCEPDVFIDVGCVFEGKVSVGAGSTLSANCVLKNCSVGAGVLIKPFCHIEDAVIGANSIIGPYARLRPGTTLGNEVHVGNFCEIKNSDIASGSKVNHLSYIGDTTMGSRVNVGAGTITCNYDGANKFRTIIEDDVFIGSDTQLIAPVTVGRGATLGAGTTLTKDAPADQLTVSRAKQISMAGWKRPQKLKKD
ncbi:MAG: bifunctional UDP-N-acetylglucosamine diphosphorylase/glucosamine-1-phosphate N-acetyltransferase GlmU [Rhodocyclaceae bacterium]|nr:bifunctional UDP-N-acetylglucosamine diphosphorylase/glucosamine-1-phosphate N-acetyltransferase GlmU [Rhodocyclaceae bacterium]MBK9624273.1 bifunctional UDP-N-acetylglucosamine diphosphorylase/glucosamine-1-phosphate N-acetyltransferase GlmU [Rhodocyclaceae bacterium]MBL0074983.1 bifunctional UDP-N-acetylglucosamine diphosphorylase/glucosamine-1-phosphate N-acetyltransferase GlmU [Rhodocyclaceae bacterium]MBP6108715.1 bifunctional UDP-N-acetylglucosamine diphosphorylase/glucosamine-1-phospha